VKKWWAVIVAVVGAYITYVKLFTGAVEVTGNVAHIVGHETVQERQAKSAKTLAAYNLGKTVVWLNRWHQLLATSKYTGTPLSPNAPADAAEKEAELLLYASSLATPTPETLKSLDFNYTVPDFGYAGSSAEQQIRGLIPRNDLIYVRAFEEGVRVQATIWKGFENRYSEADEPNTLSSALQKGVADIEAVEKGSYELGVEREEETSMRSIAHMRQPNQPFSAYVEFRAEQTDHNITTVLN
jgi:hypothetical protein